LLAISAIPADTVILAACPVAQVVADVCVPDITISFVPDHVHIAVWTHPTVVPAELAVKLLNTSRELIASEYPHLLIEAFAKSSRSPDGPQSAVCHSDREF
jgi:hypothetical protein